MLRPLRIGEIFDRAVTLCVTTTYDIETGEQNDDVLTYVALRRGNVMGVYCEVLVEGEACVGDAVELRDLRTSRTTDSSASI